MLLQLLKSFVKIKIKSPTFKSETITDAKIYEGLRHFAIGYVVSVEATTRQEST